MPIDIDVDDVFSKMLNAAAGAFQDGWESVKQYAPGEFKKIAIQLAEIGENVAKFQINPAQGYSPAVGKLLLQMQRNATESVLVAMTTLTLLAVQRAIDAVLKVVKDTVGGVLALII